MRAPCRSEHDFWAGLDAEQARLDQALYNFHKREREQRPGWFTSYWKMARWIAIWVPIALLAVAALTAFIVGWLAL